METKLSFVHSVSIMSDDPSMPIKMDQYFNDELQVSAL